MESDKNVVFKAYLDDEVRRFTIDKAVVTNFEYLKAKLRITFPNIGTTPFTIKWIDDDNDKVTISSDEDLLVALSSIPDLVKKIYITFNNNTNNNQPLNVDKDDEDDDAIVIDIDTNANLNDLLSKPPHVWTDFCKNSPHPGVICDNCNDAIVGFRYKCVVCEDYDLCGKCEGNYAHPHHIFMRFPWPMGRMATRASKKAGRMFRCLKKDKPFGDDNGGCARKYRREDSSEPFRKQPEDRNQFCQRRNGHHGDHGKHGHHKSYDNHGNRPFRGRDHWFQTFGQFVNEMTNLAGDAYGPTCSNVNGGATATATATASAQASRKSATSSTQAASAPPQPTDSENTTAFNQNGNNMPQPSGAPIADINARIIENIGATISHILKPFGMELNMELKSSNVTDNNSEQPPNPPQPSAPKANIVDDLIDATSETKKSPEKTSESPERSEGWTILNSEEHNEEASDKTPLITKPVGFDMERISNDFHRHVGFTVTSNGPSTSTSAATYEPAVPVPPIGVEKIYPTVPQPEVNSFFSPQVQNPTETEYRPKQPHIAEALDKMLAMGFKNENGRLGRLLEKKNGNIAEVLDILMKNIS